MIKRQMPKCSAELITKAEIVATEMALKTQIEQLTATYEEQRAVC
jgi:hypothetical protein